MSSYGASPPSERWAAIEIRLVAALVAVAETGSFAQAAKRLGYTQSGISQQIAALERIVDRKLLVRHVGGRRPVETTEAGATFLAHSYKLLAQIDSAFADLVAAERSQSDVAKVAALINAPTQRMAPLIREFRDEQSIRIELIESKSTRDLFASLDGGEAELAISSLPVPPRFHADMLGSDPYVAVLDRRSPLAHGAGLTSTSLVDKSVVLFQVPGQEEVVVNQLLAAGVDPARLRRYEDSRFIHALVAGGEAIAILPLLEVDVEDQATQFMPLNVQLPPRATALVRSRDRLLTPAARTFRDWLLTNGSRFFEPCAGDASRAAAS